jgi:hypothetical protein
MFSLLKAKLKQRFLDLRPLEKWQKERCEKSGN